MGNAFLDDQEGGGRITIALSGLFNFIRSFLHGSCTSSGQRPGEGSELS
jgi:hypothetical protein